MSLTRKEPVPIKRSGELMPPSISTMCLGSMMCQASARSSRKSALGCLRETLKVVSSIFSVPSMFLKPPTRGWGMPSGGFAQRLSVYEMSSTVSGLPSCHCTPSTRFTVIESTESANCQLSPRSGRTSMPLRGLNWRIPL